MNTQRWGGAASMVLGIVVVLGPLIYFTNAVRDPLSPFGYAIADLMYGPVLAASLVGSMSVIKEEIGDKASRRMAFALIAASLAALALVTAAIMRSGNRAYFIRYEQDMGKEEYAAIMRTILMTVQGTIRTGHHFIGWSLLLMGSASWNSGLFPRPLIVLALIAGLLNFFTYLLPEAEELPTVLLTGIWAIWQGVALWRRGSGSMPELAKDPQTA